MARRDGDGHGHGGGDGDGGGPAPVLLLYVVVRLSVSEVKQGTLPAQPRTYYSSYALTLLYYSLVLLCASSDIIKDVFCYQVCLIL